MAALTPAPFTTRDAGGTPPFPAHEAPGRPAPLQPARAPARARARASLWRLRFVVAATCLGLAAGATVHALRPPPPATVPVVVAARDVAAGTSLTAADLTVVEVSPAAAPRATFSRTSDVVDRVTAVDLPAQLPLAASLLTGTALTGPAGTVVVAVRLDDPAVAQILEPGLRLDLVAARLEGGPGETVARRALVLPEPDVPGAGGGLLAGATTVDDAPPLLVAVSPEEAVRIAETSASSRLVALVVP